MKFLMTSATQLVAAARGNTAASSVRPALAKRGRGFRKHHQSRATADKSQVYQWMEPLTKSPVSAITTLNHVPLRRAD